LAVLKKSKKRTFAQTTLKQIRQRRFGLIRRWLGQGLQDIEIVDKAARHIVFTHPMVAMKGRNPRRVLKRAYIFKLVHQVRHHFRTEEIDGNAELMDGLERMRLACKGAMLENNWRAAGFIQQIINRMTGVHLIHGASEFGRAPSPDADPDSFSAEQVHEQLEAMRASMPKKKGRGEDV